MATGALLTWAAGPLSFREPLQWTVCPREQVLCGVRIESANVLVVSVWDMEESILRSWTNLLVMESEAEREKRFGFAARLLTPHAEVRASGGALRIRDAWVAFPLWVPFFLLAAWPAIWVFRGPIRRYERRKSGCCPGCGYDLRGAVSNICPECGEQSRRKAT
jgi:hypothetical protein